MPADLAIRRRTGRWHDPPVVLRLIYQLFAKLLSWMVLHDRAENAKQIEILVLRRDLARTPTVRARSASIPKETARSDRTACPRVVAGRRLWSGQTMPTASKAAPMAAILRFRSSSGWSRNNVRALVSTARLPSENSDVRVSLWVSAR
jgi:hypothetical protein